MTLPEPPSKGQPVRAELIRQIIDYLRRITPVPGPNIKVRETPGGTVISGTPGGIGAETGTTPWTVRKHVTADDPDGTWEIWLPPGCMAVGGTLTPINLAASEMGGHSGDKAGWYVLALDEAEGAADTSTQGEGDSQVTTVSRTWDIVAHAKTSAKMYGVDALSAPARRLLYVSARKRLTAQEDAGQTDAERAASTWGDEFSQVVATVTVGTRTEGQAGEAQAFRRIVQASRAPISAAGRPRSNFDLVWYFGLDEDGALEVEKVYCVRISQAVAGLTVDGPEMADVTDASGDVYARIATNPNAGSANQGENILTIVVAPSSTPPDDYTTWLRIYAMSSNAVVADYRASALVNVQVFR